MDKPLATNTPPEEETNSKAARCGKAAILIVVAVIGLPIVAVYNVSVRAFVEVAYFVLFHRRDHQRERDYEQLSETVVGRVVNVQQRNTGAEGMKEWWTTIQYYVEERPYTISRPVHGATKAPALHQAVRIKVLPDQPDSGRAEADISSTNHYRGSLCKTVGCFIWTVVLTTLLVPEMAQYGPTGLSELYEGLGKTWSNLAWWIILGTDVLLIAITAIPVYFYDNIYGDEHTTTQKAKAIDPVQAENVIV